MGHRLRIRQCKELKRGYRLSFACPDCDASGVITVPTEATATSLFALVRDGHEQGNSSRET